MQVEFVGEFLVEESKLICNINFDVTQTLRCDLTVRQSRLFVGVAELMDRLFTVLVNYCSFQWSG
jgi:hypothetical protein